MKTKNRILLLLASLVTTHSVSPLYKNSEASDNIFNATGASVIANLIHVVGTHIAVDGASKIKELRKQIEQTNDIETKKHLEEKIGSLLHGINEMLLGDKVFLTASDAHCCGTTAELVWANANNALPLLHKRLTEEEIISRAPLLRKVLAWIRLIIGVLHTHTQAVAISTPDLSYVKKYRYLHIAKELIAFAEYYLTYGKAPKHLLVLVSRLAYMIYASFNTHTASKDQKKPIGYLWSRKKDAPVIDHRRLDHTIYYSDGRSQNSYTNVPIPDSKNQIAFSNGGTRHLMDLGSEELKNAVITQDKEQIAFRDLEDDEILRLGGGWKTIPYDTLVFTKPDQPLAGIPDTGSPATHSSTQSDSGDEQTNHEESDNEDGNTAGTGTGEGSSADTREAITISVGDSTHTITGADFKIIYNNRHFVREAGSQRWMVFDLNDKKLYPSTENLNEALEITAQKVSNGVSITRTPAHLPRWNGDSSPIKYKLQDNQFVLKIINTETQENTLYLLTRNRPNNYSCKKITRVYPAGNISTSDEQPPKKVLLHLNGEHKIFPINKAINALKDMELPTTGISECYACEQDDEESVGAGASAGTGSSAQAEQKIVITIDDSTHTFRNTNLAVLYNGNCFLRNTASGIWKRFNKRDESILPVSADLHTSLDQLAQQEGAVPDRVIGKSRVAILKKNGDMATRTLPENQYVLKIINKQTGDYDYYVCIQEEGAISSGKVTSVTPENITIEAETLPAKVIITTENGANIIDTVPETNLLRQQELPTTGVIEVYACPEDAITITVQGFSDVMTEHQKIIKYNDTIFICWDDTWHTAGLANNNIKKIVYRILNPHIHYDLIEMLNFIKENSQKKLLEFPRVARILISNDSERFQTFDLKENERVLQIEDSYFNILPDGRVAKLIPITDELHMEELNPQEFLNRSVRYRVQEGFKVEKIQEIVGNQALLNQLELPYSGIIKLYELPKYEITQSPSPYATTADKRCTICQDQPGTNGTTVSKTQCSHTFCTACLETNTKKYGNDECPTCRAKITQVTEYSTTTSSVDDVD